MALSFEHNPRFTANLPKVSMVYPDTSTKDYSVPKEQSKLLSKAGTSALPPVTSSQPIKRSVFAQHYKEITFDTLKERHDNFSFEKVIDTKNQLHDTIFFNNPPNNPNLILFMKQTTTPAVMMERKIYSNSNYVNNSDSASFYN